MNPINSPVLRYVCACLLSSFVAVEAHGQNIFGTNLILNGDAEAGVASTGGDAPGGIVSVPHWLAVGAFTVNRYGESTATHRVLFDAAGSPAAGTNYVAGGPTNGDSFATQEVDLSSVATEIDAGVVKYCMAGYFGGFHHQNDNAALTVTFLTADNTVLGTNMVGHVLSADRSDNTSTGSLLLRKSQGLLPAGTRRVRFLLFMSIDTTVSNQSYNDGYADGLSFVVTSPGKSGAGLSVLRTNGPVLVRWPAGLTGFNLQTTSQLQPPIAWTTITNSIGVANGWFVCTNTPTSPNQFFRLAF